MGILTPNKFHGSNPDRKVYSLRSNSTTAFTPRLHVDPVHNHHGTDAYSGIGTIPYRTVCMISRAGAQHNGSWSIHGTATGTDIGGNLFPSELLPFELFPEGNCSVRSKFVLPFFNFSQVYRHCCLLAVARGRRNGEGRIA